MNAGDDQDEADQDRVKPRLEVLERAFRSSSEEAHREVSLRPPRQSLTTTESHEQTPPEPGSARREAHNREENARTTKRVAGS